MDSRLGATLIRLGHIDRSALDEALGVQVTSGGRLGSVLVSLGYLQEDQLAEILAAHHRLPVATHQELEAADPDLFGRYTREFAAFHQVICLAVRGRELDLAMVDPGDVTAREAVADRTRRKLRVKVIPEGLFWSYAAKHFGLKRPPRLVMDLGREGSWSRGLSTPLLPRASATPEVQGSLEATPEAATATATADLASQPLPKSTNATATATSGPGPDAAIEGLPPASLQAPEQNSEFDLQTTSGLLAFIVGASDRVAIGEGLTRWAALNRQTFVALVVRRDLVVPWVGQLEDGQPLSVDGTGFALSSSPLVKDVVVGGRGYQGIAPPLGDPDPLFNWLGRRPRELLLVPIKVQGRVVNLLYLDGGERDPLSASSLGAAEQLAEALSSTYLRLILTRRAHSTP